MNNDTTRYSGPPTIRRSYMRAFLVHCPKCKGPAQVTTDLCYDTSNDQLVCQNCNHIEKVNGLIRYKAIIKRACDNCGKAIDAVIPNNKEKVKELKVSCPYCGQLRTYKPINQEYRLYYKNKGVGDPVFNLPLWFQADIRGDVFWAYNRDHLNEIRNYVAAKLRERQITTHTTMVEKLPNFIKAAKNRAIIIRAIDRLMKKIK